MARRGSTIGANPLDSVIPQSPAPAVARPAAAGLERFSSSLPAELLERARDCVFWTPGLTLAALLEEGLRGVVERLETEQEGGQFKPRSSAKLRAGRQVR